MNGLVYDACVPFSHWVLTAQEEIKRSSLREQELFFPLMKEVFYVSK